MLTTPLAACFALCLALIAITWALSVVTREYSWVDRIWSVAPPVYAWIVAGWGGFVDPRLTLMAVLISAWGARLTFNYARKGGYAPGGEDYRWAILREKLGPVGFQLFNATFIAPYQNLLILGMTLPIVACADAGGALGPADLALALAFLGFLTTETIADQQQWRFHEAKKARASLGEPEEKGFLDEGLWAMSRHPNFFGELGQWWVVYGFSVAAGAAWVNPSLTGVVLLTLLFHGSTVFTEQITASKYLKYADYQRRVSRWIPWPASPGAAATARP
jgi:steroid 5-alpha reductase family enzyme